MARDDSNVGAQWAQVTVWLTLTFIVMHMASHSPGEAIKLFQ